MAKITAANVEPFEGQRKLPRIQVEWNANPLPAAIALFLVLAGQVSVLSDSYPVRVGAVLVAIVIVFLAGMRFGRAEQARELLLED